MEAELVPPTKEEAYELFDEFNDKKNGKIEDCLEKEEYEKFSARVFEMLNSTIQSWWYKFALNKSYKIQYHEKTFKFEHLIDAYFRLFLNDFHLSSISFKIYG